MISDQYVKDIGSVTLDNVPRVRQSAAISRLSKGKRVAGRILAAQACARGNVFPKASLIAWLEREKNVEIRCYLYLGLAKASKRDAIAYFKKILKSNISVKEKLYLSASLAICYRSRKYLLEVMIFMYNPNKSISSEAAGLSYILIDETDGVSLDFLKLIVKDSGADLIYSMD